MEVEKKVEKKQKCKSCGARFTQKDMKYGPDPFLADLYNDKRKIWLCVECYKKSRDEI